MPLDYSRGRRVGELIQRELAMLLMKEVKDPRLTLVSITAVDVTRDLGLAKVFYTVISQDGVQNESQEQDTRKNVQQSLKKAAGFLRYQLGQRIDLRVVPQLDFRYDVSVAHGVELTKLINDAIADDEKRHNLSDSNSESNPDSDRTS